ncbi:MAG: hypothetical protein PHW53_03590 [Patescibacteria group bacterium]|nr:hypothetical protein [Patescibacteria group bacterium]
MSIEVNYAFINKLLAMSGPQAFWYFFIHGGWIAILIILLWGSYKVYLYKMQIRDIKSHQYILLAIDVPKDNVQSPMAVEHIFAHLAGAHSSPSLREQYWFGSVQPWFSLEIASIEGYIQYFIRTPAKFRNLVEAAIYAQYPDAEITEVEDYTYLVPVKHFPDPEWEMWGCDFVMVKPESWPLRTYPEFEHGLSQEFKDPLSALLENLSLVGPGEHVWFQLMIVPIEQKAWKMAGDKLVKKMIGAKMESKPSTLDKILDIPFKALDITTEAVFGTGEPIKKDKKQDLPSKMLYLSPGDVDRVKAIERKISKIGYKSKIRAVYVAKKPVYKKTNVAHPLIGAIKQFNSVSLNALKPELSKTGVSGSMLFFKKQRQNYRRNRLIAAYRQRDPTSPMSPYIMNTEELASIWHFPAIEVKAPLVKKTDAKKGEPPMYLPYDKPAAAKEIFKEEPAPTVIAEELPPGVPGNLPFEK